MIKIRASSLGELFDCPARWAAKYILNMKMPTNTKALLGTAIHASTAAYDQSQLDKAGITIEDAKAAAVDALFNPKEDVIWDDETAKDLEPIALSLHTKYCTFIAPKFEYAAVEVKCGSLIIADLGIELTGTTDRVYINSLGQYGIGDVKSGKSAVGADGVVATKGHGYQMGVYELLAEQGSGLPIEAPAQIMALTTAKTEKSQRYGVGEISGAREILLGDEFQTGVLHEASRLIHSGIYIGNPKSMMCHKNYCPSYQNCRFRK